MRVLIANTQDLYGGAARAAYRLHQGLRRVGVDAHMLVQERQGDDSHVHGPKTKFQIALALARPTLDQLAVYRYRNRLCSPFSPAWLPERRVAAVSRFQPDAVHLHWITRGFVRIESLASFKLPLILTLHDMWPFTGGCHYDGGCGRFRTDCGACPVLGSTREQDLARSVFSRKRKSWSNLKLTLISPSKWLAECAQQSTLLGRYRVEVIPNGLDLGQYRPLDKKLARQLIGVPPSQQLILFGAIRSTSDKRKGFEHLQRALHVLAKRGWKDKAAVLVVGASEPANAPDLALSAHYLGKLQDDISLAALYSAADVFVAPSLQENLSNMVMEALACGTPCVTFDVGGMSDMIEHRHNGYLAIAFEPEDLAAGITYVLDDEQRHQALSRRARKKVEEEFDLTQIASRHKALYEEVVANSGM